MNTNIGLVPNSSDVSNSNSSSSNINSLKSQNNLEHSVCQLDAPTLLQQIIHVCNTMQVEEILCTYPFFTFTHVYSSHTNDNTHAIMHHTHTLHIHTHTHTHTFTFTHIHINTLHIHPHPHIHIHTISCTRRTVQNLLWCAEGRLMGERSIT